MGQWPKGRSGSAQSDKQLARAVVHGRRVICQWGEIGETGWTEIGYLCGWDDYHWTLVSVTDGQLDVRLVHKGLAPVVRVDPISTYDTDPDRDQLEPIVAPFRTYCERLLSRKGSQNEELQQSP